MSARSPLPVKWTKSAWEDLSGITDYLLSEGVAFEDVEDNVKRIFMAPEHLATLPGAGKPGRVPNTREWLVKDTAYAFIYRVMADKVQILHVMRSGR